MRRLAPSRTGAVSEREVVTAADGSTIEWTEATWTSPSTQSPVWADSWDVWYARVAGHSTGSEPSGCRLRSQGWKVVLTDVRFESV